MIDVKERYEEVIRKMREADATLPPMDCRYDEDTQLVTLVTEGLERRYVAHPWSIPEKQVRETWMAAYNKRLWGAEVRGLA